MQTLQRHRITACPLAVRAPDNSTTYTLCDGVASSGSCAAEGSSFVRTEFWSVPLYLPWDPAIGLADGNYDLSCSVSDGANTSSTDYASHSDEVRLNSTSPTVLEVREAAGAVVPTSKMMISLSK